MEEYMTTKEACEKYKISVTTLWRWVAKGKIQQFKDPVSGRSYYLPIMRNYLTVKEACYALSISRSTLHRYMLKGLITPIPNHNTLFTQSEIDNFIENKFNSLEQVKPVISMERI